LRARLGRVVWRSRSSQIVFFKTASVWQVREPLYRRSSGRWRNYAPHLDKLRAYLEDLRDPAAADSRE
jgi:hypothetical protein